jgi:competence protein ComEC
MAASGVALVGGLIAGAGGPAAIATILGLPGWFLLSVIVGVIQVSARLPFASATLEPPWTVVAACVAGAIPFAIQFRHRLGWSRRSPKRASSPTPPAPNRHASGRSSRGQGRAVAMGIAGSLIALTLAVVHRPDGSTRITVLDVGQGDAILVEGGRGGRLLVDGGPDPDRLLIELDRRLPPWDRRIDAVILTHPHEDHVAGLALLLTRYRIGRVFEPGMRGPGPGYGAWAAFLGAPGAPPRARLVTGDRLDVDDLAFRVLWPDPGRVPDEPSDGGRAINDVSIVLLGEVDGRRILLTGDVEDDVDPVLTARGLPPVDLLKVAHHGSGTASTVAFLGVVKPSVAVVSAGADNPYGHPARTTLEHLRETGAQVLRTDQDGSVEIAIGGGAMTVHASGGRAAAEAAPGSRTAVGLGAGVLGRSGGAAAVPFSCAVPSSG